MLRRSTGIVVEVGINILALFEPVANLFGPFLEFFTGIGRGIELLAAVKADVNEVSSDLLASRPARGISDAEGNIVFPEVL